MTNLTDQIGESREEGEEEVEVAEDEEEDGEMEGL